MGLRTPQALESINVLALFSQGFVLVIKPAPTHVVTTIGFTGIPDDGPVKEMRRAITLTRDAPSVPIINRITIVEIKAAAQRLTIPRGQPNPGSSRWRQRCMNPFEARASAESRLPARS